MCQHGPQECFGNIVQACVLQQVPQPQEHVPLINCIMASDFPPEAFEVCLGLLDITTTSVERLSECAESEEGSSLLHQIGLKTGSLEPHLTGVPWLLFNEVSIKTAYHLPISTDHRSSTETTGYRE